MPWLHIIAGEMGADEIVQCVLDIKSWFSRTSCKRDIKEGASSADIQRLEKTIDTALPRAMKLLLQEVNGGLYFLDKKQLGVRDIQDFVDSVERSKNWKSGLVPLCGDDSSALVVDTTDGDCVREWDADDGLGDELSGTIVRFLENYRNDLLGGVYEFVDDLGVVEKMGKARK